MPFATDSFTDSAGTLITAHTSDSGHSWTLHPATGASSNSQISNANRFRNGSSTKIIVAYINSAPASADYDVQAGLVYKTDQNQVVSVLGRIDTAVDTWIRFGHFTNSVSHKWQVQESVNGTAVQIGSDSNQTLTVDQEYTAKLSIRGPTVNVSVDGAAVCGSPITTSVTGAGRAGIHFNAIAMTDSTGTHIDNFSANDAAPFDAPSPYLVQQAINRAAGW